MHQESMVSAASRAFPQSSFPSDVVLICPVPQPQLGHSICLFTGQRSSFWSTPLDLHSEVQNSAAFCDRFAPNSIARLIQIHDDKDGQHVEFPEKDAASDESRNDEGKHRPPQQMRSSFWRIASRAPASVILTCFSTHLSLSSPPPLPSLFLSGLTCRTHSHTSAAVLRVLPSIRHVRVRHQHPGPSLQPHRLSPARHSRHLLRYVYPQSCARQRATDNDIRNLFHHPLTRRPPTKVYRLSFRLARDISLLPTPPPQVRPILHLIQLHSENRHPRF